MNTSQHRESAQIIPFRPRAERAGSRREPIDALLEQAQAVGARVACGSNWYHDAAVEEAIRTVKR